MSCKLICVALACALLFPLYAQLTTGSITGTVADSTGALMPGVKVTLTNTSTSVARTATTDTAGVYRFLLLLSGTYRIEVANAGFKGYRRDGIIVEVDRSLAVPVVLEVGQVTATVEVTAGTPLLEPNTSSLGTVMDQRKIEDLPLNGRNPMVLANLISTVRGIRYFGGQLLFTWRMGWVLQRHVLSDRRFDAGVQGADQRDAGRVRADGRRHYKHDQQVAGQHRVLFKHP